MEAQRLIPVTLDFRKPTQIPMPQIQQYDSNVFKFTVLDDGNPADLSNVDRVVVNFRKPNKKMITRIVTPSDNVITYLMSKEEMDKDGPGELNLQIYEGSNRLSSAIMKVYITRNLGEFDGVEGVPLLQELFLEVKDLTEQSQTNSTYALNQGDYAKQEAENLSQLKVDVSSATEAASEASSLANENAVNAENQANYAKEQGDYAKAQADLSNEQYERLKDTDVSTLSAQLAEKATEKFVNQEDYVETLKRHTNPVNMIVTPNDVASQKL